MHGVQASPNAIPATGAATGPKRSRCGWKRNSWYSRGVMSSCDPARYNAMRITSAPEMRVSVSWFSKRTSPAGGGEEGGRLRVLEQCFARSGGDEAEQHEHHGEPGDEQGGVVRDAREHLHVAFLH